MFSTELLTQERFKLYGDVISLPTTSQGVSSSVSANQGTAKRINHLARIIQKTGRPSGQPAQLNPCFFVTAPQCKGTNIFSIQLLERHLFSSQLFLPCRSANDAHYLVIVCLNNSVDKPDLRTLKAFIATSNQGINYHPGVWHHPMVALNKTITFFMFGS